MSDRDIVVAGAIGVVFIVACTVVARVLAAAIALIVSCFVVAA